MTREHVWPITGGAILLLLAGCAGEQQDSRYLISETFPDAQAEIHDAVMSIKSDIESANIEGLQAVHLLSDKFTKFGPRSFERQDVGSANDSEAAFFGSISDATYEVKDLKIDVFGDVGIATYYPEVTFTRDGEFVEVNGRQTLVFLKTEGEWKLVHEHGTVRN